MNGLDGDVRGCSYVPFFELFGYCGPIKDSLYSDLAAPRAPLGWPVWKPFLNRRDTFLR